MNPESQCTSFVLMIRPSNFGFNPETASSNAFQSNNERGSQEHIQSMAIAEFDALVNKLQENNIRVLKVEDTPNPKKPDAIFPNNWITTHSDGSVITYPMLSEIRRAERRDDIIDLLEQRFKLKQRYSFEYFEEENKFLEGTGSMILDRVNKVVYACISPRTNIELLDKFTLLKDYEMINFLATDPLGIPVYHTNVIMALGMSEVIICTACILNESEKNRLLHQLEQNGKTVIEISWEQVLKFAGNMLQIRNTLGEYIWLMSSSAFESLSMDQQTLLTHQARIIHSPIPTIEKYGGGSVRCMLAEIFLPLK